MSGAERKRFVVTAGDQSLRLDQLLAAKIDGLSRRKARVLLDIGGVYVDGKRVKTASRRLRAGQSVEAVIGGALSRATSAVGEKARARDAEALPDFEVVFEDDHLVVINKPAGLLAAPTPEGDRGNVCDQLARRPGSSGRVFVVHRIDLPTSGLLVYAKSPEANANLSSLFREHDVERLYDAIVAGAWPDDLKTIDAPLEGRRAVSHFSVAQRGEHSTHLEVRLETGRTHQIRIHCADVGHPVLGDKRYATDASPRASRLCLHARVLGFAHPITGENVRFETARPPELRLV